MNDRRTNLATRSRGAGAADDLAVPGLVHELRQPLAGVEAGLALVARAVGPTATDLDGWHIATDQLARLRETLDTYDQLTSPGGAGQAAFAVEPVVRCAIDAVRHRLGGDPDRVALAVERGIPSAHGSAAALLHAVANLLGNALDAVAAAGGAGRIEVRVLPATDASRRARVRVADEGVGIPPGDVPRLFAPRFTTKAPGAGSGIGLALARRMLRQAGGELRLAAHDDPERRPWSRTEFVVDLATGPGAPAPLDRAALPPRRADPRRVAAGAGVAAVALGFVAAGAWGLHPRLRAADVDAVVAEEAAPGIEVLERGGRLERLEGGAWQPVGVGARLLADDTIRTAAGSATLGFGEGTRVSVSDATQLTVREITDAVQRLRLTRGRISVDHQADGTRVLVVEGDGAESAVRARTARFSVLASGTALAVATEAGAVRLQSLAGAVDVRAGEQSVVFRGGAPRAARPIPPALLLRVARAMPAPARGPCLVEGAADPGAEVTVDGRAVELDASGRFTVEVPASGSRRATVLTRDAAGRAVRRLVACTVEHDVSRFAVEWGEDEPTSR